MNKKKIARRPKKIKQAQHESKRKKRETKLKHHPLPI